MKEKNASRFSIFNKNNLQTIFNIQYSIFLGNIMPNTKNSKAFCNTSYKKWLVLLGVMVVILVVWMAIGFDEDKAQANLDKMALMEREHGGEGEMQEGHIQMSRLQESYSDIAAKTREVTVNISATRVNFGVNGNPGGLSFADPFWNTPQQLIGGPNNLENSPPGVIGVKATAPPIASNATMPHPFKGVCSNCHIIKKKMPAKNMAAPAPGRTSIGSGIIVDSSGYIITNYHIINTANDIIVTTANGNKYRAEVKYTDVPGDLAILKINSPTRLPAAVLGDSDIIQEGDIVLAVGNPFGLNQTVTSGIISDSNRTVLINGRQFNGLIQTDAAINRGSSGGPLVNIKGEVIGINTAIYSMTGDFTGVGFAIPINRAKETFVSVPAISALAANLIDMSVGEIITIAMQPNIPDAWFGAEVSSIDTIMADQFGLNDNSGVMVNRVFAESPAEISGLMRGDVILKINGRKTANVKKFQKITSLLKAGETINLTVKRNTKQIKLTALLDNSQNRKITKKTARRTVAGPAEMEWAGMEVVPITREIAKRYGIRKGKAGVVVLEAGGMAAAAGIMRGDVIQGLNRKRVNNMADFMSAATNANIAEGVLFDISRQGDPLFITM